MTGLPETPSPASTLMLPAVRVISLNAHVLAAVLAENPVAATKVDKASKSFAKVNAIVPAPIIGTPAIVRLSVEEVASTYVTAEPPLIGRNLQSPADVVFPTSHIS